MTDALWKFPNYLEGQRSSHQSYRISQSISSSSNSSNFKKNFFKFYTDTDTINLFGLWRNGNPPPSYSPGSTGLHE